MQTEFARKIVVVGGSAGGAGVVARLRRLNENAEILLIEKSRMVSYSTCGIPYYLGNVIKDSERMQSLSGEEFSQLLSVDLRTRHEVTAINRRAQNIELRDLKSGKTFNEAYDKLVLALGSQPNKLPRKISAKNVFVIRGYEETAVIKHYIHAKSCRRAVVVGAGFIGLEMAENLARLGMQVCIIDKSKQVLHNWDPEMAAVVRRHLKDKKISVMLNESVSGATEDYVKLESGRKIKSDIVILAMGVRPNSELAAACDLNIGPHGGILVNAGLRTSDPNIYALGDAVEIQDHGIAHRPPVYFAGPAQKQARVVAENIAGRHSSYRPGHVSSIVKVFNLTAAATGKNELELLSQNIPYLKSYTESPSNASFYPGAQSMVTKLLFSPDNGRLLGAQIIGAAGVDKRIDVLATALHGKLTVTDLAELELGYAPPYSSARDPVNVAAMVACNMLYEDYQVIHWHNVDEAIAKGYTVLDVRSEEEFELRKIPQSINIPLESLRDRMDELQRERPILVYCGYGKKGYFAYKILRNNGFSYVFNLSGGLTVYSMAKLQSSSESKPSIEFHCNDSGVDEIVPEESQAAAPLEKTQRASKSRLSKPVKPAVEQEALQDAESEEYDDSWNDDHAEVDELDFDTLLADENIVLEQQPLRTPSVAYIEVDASGLSCPGPIMKLAKTMHSANQGDIVQITATDTGFAHDIHNWCQKKGHKLLEFDDSSATIRAVLLKS